MNDLTLRINLIKKLHPNQNKKWYEAFITAENGNYLNNWNELYPLILEHKIERHLTIDGHHLFDAYADEKDCFTVTKESDSEVQRGYCECLFKVLTAKENNYLVCFT